MTLLNAEIEFITELEKLKTVSRYNKVIGGVRQENSAEHSWHLAVMAILFADRTKFENLDLLKVLKMVLIHDIVEIDCGDSFLYDDQKRQDSVLTEAQAAERIFGLLPGPLGTEFMALWQEFEARKSPEALYAASLDALQPLLNHLVSCPPHCNEAQLTRSKVLGKKAFIADVSPALWQVATDVIDRSVEQGLYHDC